MTTFTPSDDERFRALTVEHCLGRATDEQLAELDVLTQKQREAYLETLSPEYRAAEEELSAARKGLISATERFLAAQKRIQEVKP